jgi:malate synthase
MMMVMIVTGLSFQVAREVFVQGMHNANHQKHRLREDVHVAVDELLTVDVQGGKITEEGVRKNTSVALKYINEWLQVSGVPRIQPKVKYV